MKLPQPFSIVAAQRAHVPAIFAMVRELAQYEKLEHLVSGTADDLATELFGARPLIEAVVALANATPVGFVLYFHNYSTFLARRGLYLEDVYVQPAHRQRGIGRALLIYLARLAVERDCGRFEWSVLNWNQPAIRFYEGLGATVMPDWRIARVTGDALRSLAARSTIGFA
ncbi:MAG TPA: GNAT family N-acetyltransferase [Burkholderiales bacterium]|nr:GNAT family N-acetyltransferase [Burkholderiales bacterium]